MESFFNKEAMITLLSATDGIDTYSNMRIVLALIEIREAIEAQTKWMTGDFGASHRDRELEACKNCLDEIEKLKERVDKLEASIRAHAHLLEAIERSALQQDTEVRRLRDTLCAFDKHFTANVAALEKVLQGVVNHQTETAKLLQELTEKIEGNVPAAGGAGPGGGLELPSPASGQLTAG